MSNYLFFPKYENPELFLEPTKPEFDSEKIIPQEQTNIIFAPIQKYSDFSSNLISKYSEELLAVALIDGNSKKIVALSSCNDNIDTDFVICLSELFLNILENKYIKLINNLSNEEKNSNEDVLVQEIDLLKDSTLELIKRISNNYFVLLLFSSEFSKNKVFALKTLNKISSEFEKIV